VDMGAFSITLNFFHSFIRMDDHQLSLLKEEEKDNNSCAYHHTPSQGIEDLESSFCGNYIM